MSDLDVLEKEIGLAEAHLSQNDELLKKFPDSKTFLTEVLSLNRFLNVMSHIRNLYQEVEKLREELQKREKQ
jgi:hypothetical protein